jgi:hypothetical protein
MILYRFARNHPACSAKVSWALVRQNSRTFPSVSAWQLSRTSVNAVVLAEHDPAALARKRQPRRIVSLLGGLLAIDIG